MKDATEWVWGYIAALAVKEVKHLAGHDFGVGVLHRLHLVVHHALVLDNIANRCFAQGTNAWTDVDHTWYVLF